MKYLCAGKIAAFHSKEEISKSWHLLVPADNTDASVLEIPVTIY